MGDLETCVVRSGQGSDGRWQIDSRVLERYCHSARSSGWSLLPAWLILRRCGETQRYYHVGNLTWQLVLPSSHCGSGAVSAQRGSPLMSEEWRDPMVVRPTGRATKNLQWGTMKTKIRHLVPIVRFPQTFDRFEHRDYSYAIGRNTRC